VCFSRADARPKQRVDFLAQRSIIVARLIEIGVPILRLARERFLKNRLHSRPTGRQLPHASTLAGFSFLCGPYPPAKRRSAGGVTQFIATSRVSTQRSRPNFAPGARGTKCEFWRSCCLCRRESLAGRALSASVAPPRRSSLP